MSSENALNREQVFVRPDSAGLSATMWMLAGAAAIAFAVVGLVVAIRGRVGPMALQSMTTMPTLVGLGAIAAGWTMLRAPRRVSVGPDGLTIETKQGTRRVRWDEVGFAAVETGGTNHRRRLNVTDLRGKSIAMLDESFSRFDVMTSLIANHMESKGEDTASPILRKKARRQAVMAFVIGLFMAFACGFIVWSTYQKQRADRLLEERGQPGEAEIVRRFLAPNGVTRRLEYRVVGADGQSATENVEVEPAYWESLEGKKTIPVIVVPGEPGISRMEEGRAVRDDEFTRTPGGGYPHGDNGRPCWPALFLLVSGVLMWNGWDLGLQDSKTRTWKVKRYGKVVWSSGGKAAKESFWEAG